MNPWGWTMTREEVGLRMVPWGGYGVGEKVSPRG
jgi:hypothetical protein